MKLIISIFITLFSLVSLNAQQDSATTKVIYPVGQVADTSKIQSLIVTDLNKPLVAKEYYVITEYWIFANDTKKTPEPFKQRVIDISTGALLNNFKENIVWSKPVKR